MKKFKKSTYFLIPALFAAVVIINTFNLDIKDWSQDYILIMSGVLIAAIGSGMAIATFINLNKKI